MPAFAKPIQELINAFRRFPGVGEKAAQRFVFYLLQQPPAERKKLGEQITKLTALIVRCNVCGILDESSPCKYDRDKSRDATTLCVVAQTTDVGVIEDSGEYRGLYHVLGDVLNPLSGVTPEQLNIDALIRRIRSTGVREVIIATNPDMEGETTALHLKKVLTPLKVKITRLGRGLPMGASLEYADEVTVAHALRGRLKA